MLKKSAWLLHLIFGKAPPAVRDSSEVTVFVVVVVVVVVVEASASTFSGSGVRTPSGGEGLLKVCCRRTSRFGHLCSQCLRLLLAQRARRVGGRI